MAQKQIIDLILKELKKSRAEHLQLYKDIIQAISILNAKTKVLIFINYQ